MISRFKKVCFLLDLPPVSRLCLWKALSEEGQASHGELLFIWNEPLGKHVTWHTGLRSAFEVDGLGEKNGWGKKRRLPSEEIRTEASFSSVSSSPSFSVTYRRSTKGVWVYNQCILWEPLSSHFFRTHKQNHPAVFCFRVFVFFKIKLPPMTKITTSF